MNPGSSWVHHWYAHSLETQGRSDEAMKEMRLALSLDPMSLVYYWDISNELLQAQRYDEALQLMHKADEMFPHYWLIEWFEMEAYSRKGDMAAVDRTLTDMKNSNADMANAPTFLGVLGVAAAREGRKAEGRALLDRMEAMRPSTYVEPYMGLELAIALGDAGLVRTWFDRFKEERSTLWLYLPLAARYMDPNGMLKDLLPTVK